MLEGDCCGIRYLNEKGDKKMMLRTSKPLAIGIMPMQTRFCLALDYSTRPSGSLWNGT